MKKFLSFLIIAAFVLFGSNFVFSMVQVGEEVAQRFETPHPYPGIKGVVWEKEIQWPNAGYIAIHFSEFNLAKGDYVEISSPDGRFYYRFSEKGKKVKHKNRTEELSEFWATHIPEDKVIVRLVSKNKRSGHGFVIDKYARGYESGYIRAVLAGLEEEAMFEAICSSDDKEWAPCYDGTTMYDKARAVCRLLIGGTSACTGWLLGSEGHIMTNNHCISTQSSASNTDYEFMAEGATCSTSCASWGACPGTVEASSGTLIQTDSALDYTLILLPTNITGTYGYMQFRDTLPTVGERIYIPQHPSAYGKQIAVLSDTDGPYAKIYSLNETPCSGGPGDIGYYADTEGGSSGSPVLAYDDNLVVALHHCANCPNRGVPIPSIITDLGSNIPANAIGGGGPPLPPVADFSASPTTVEVGNNVQFTDLSTNTPTSWSWTFEGGTPSSSTAQNPVVTYNTIGTYNVTLTATNSAGSDTETKVDYITVQDVVIEYCTSSGNDQSYEYIAGVSVGDLTNNSGASGYSDFTYITADLTAGSSVSVSLTPGFPGSSYTEYWRIWIDYNVDGDFEDSGEVVFSGSGASTVTGSFTVPSGVEAVTRMRVSMSYSTYPPACGTFTYGEVEDYTVDISGGTPPPQYTLTTNTVGNGSITLNPPGGIYDEGTVVTLTAVPASGWQFDGWSGDLSGTANPTTITMNSNKNVTATFSEIIVPQYTLTVNIVGQGGVTLNPPGGVYDEGTVVTLTATPASGWQFNNWSGDLSGTQNPATITMNSNKTVTANFSETGGCTETVGYTTVFGSSSTSGNRRAMPFTMPENGEICSVTIYHAGGSGGLILGVYDGTSTPQNRLGVTPATTINSSAGWQTINLSSPAYVAGGSTVWLAWVFQNNPGIRYETGSPGRYQSSDTWSGGMPDPFGSGSQTNYIYSIYANYTPSAPPQYTLTVNTVGQGSVSLNPAGGVYDAGTVVTLTATPDSGWKFDNWSGDLSGSTNPTTIIMNANKTVTANFSEVGTTGTVGITTAYSSSSTSDYRRAMPFTMPENGTITSVTMYHTGGSGSMILAVYDGEGTPQARLAVTPSTTVSGSTGWQTINLSSPAYVASGATVWLAWVYQSNPGIRYQTGSPGRYQSTQTWSGGMPDPFGSGSQTNYVYSIYATYNK
jgi:lysyl endopeptidase